MKVQEAIDKINQEMCWEAGCKSRKDIDGYKRHDLIVLHDLNGVETVAFVMTLEEEHPLITWEDVLARNSQDNFDGLYTVLSVLNDLRNTLPKNRGISDPLFKIHVLPGDYGYLSANLKDGNYLVSSGEEDDVPNWKCRFTEHEIDQLKLKEDVAVDWDKAKLEPADNDEQD